jgi:TfoX/Sxy family transcriptional regulator of competence genes
MAYDEKLADRVRAELDKQAPDDEVVEKKMFGGLCFMVAGAMAVGVTGTDLMVRVGKDAHEQAVAQPHARPMDFTGRPMKGFVFVDAAGTSTQRHVGTWVRQALARPS